MKNEIQLILEELKNIEKAENTEVITQDKIAEICKKHGSTFKELRDSVLKILADETGISLDELESLSFKEISEEDLVNVSSGASNMRRVTAASLAAILNCSSFAAPHATQPPSTPVRAPETKAPARLTHRKLEKQTSNKRTAAKWEIGIGATALAIILGVRLKQTQRAPRKNVKEDGENLDNILGSSVPSSDPQTDPLEDVDTTAEFDRKVQPPQFRGVTTEGLSEIYNTLTGPDKPPFNIWMSAACEDAYESNKTSASVYIAAAYHDHTRTTDIVLHTQPILATATPTEFSTLFPSRVNVDITSTHPLARWIKTNLQPPCESPAHEPASLRTNPHDRQSNIPPASANITSLVPPPLQGANVVSANPHDPDQITPPTTAADEIPFGVDLHELPMGDTSPAIPPRSSENTGLVPPPPAAPSASTANNSFVPPPLPTDSQIPQFPIIPPPAPQTKLEKELPLGVSSQELPMSADSLAIPPSSSEPTGFVPPPPAKTSASTAKNIFVPPPIPTASQIPQFPIIPPPAPQTKLEKELPLGVSSQELPMSADSLAIPPSSYERNSFFPPPNSQNVGQQPPSGSNVAQRLSPLPLKNIIDATRNILDFLSSGASQSDFDPTSTNPQTRMNADYLARAYNKSVVDCTSWLPVDTSTRFITPGSLLNPAISAQIQNIPKIIASHPATPFKIYPSQLFQKQFYENLKQRVTSANTELTKYNSLHQDKKPLDFIPGHDIFSFFPDNQQTGKSTFHIICSPSQCDHLESVSTHSVPLSTAYVADHSAGPALASVSLPAQFAKEDQVLSGKIPNMYDSVKNELTSPDKPLPSRPCPYDETDAFKVDFFEHGYINLETAGDAKGNDFKQAFAKAIVQNPPAHYSQLALDNSLKHFFQYNFLSALSCQCPKYDFGSAFSKAFLSFIKDQNEITNAFLMYLWLYIQSENALTDSIRIASENPDTEIMLHVLKTGEGAFNNYQGQTCLIWKVLFGKYAQDLSSVKNLSIKMHTHLGPKSEPGSTNPTANFNADMFTPATNDSTATSAALKNAIRVMLDYRLSGYEASFGTNTPEPIQDLVKFYGGNPEFDVAKDPNTTPDLNHKYNFGTYTQKSLPDGANIRYASSKKNNQIGQSNTQFGQPTTNFGQTNTQFGQPNTQFGQPNTQFGQTNTSFGQPNTQFGQTNTSFGPPNTNFGPPNTNFGQSNTNFGQPNTNFGQPNTNFGQPNTNFGQPNTNFGQSNTNFGQQQHQFGQQSAPANKKLTRKNPNLTRRRNH